MKISLIIPVHNAEKYLKRCLDSVLASLENDSDNSGEIILVCNNSRDNSLKIAKEIAKDHQKIIKIHYCSTWGAAAARNYGIKKASGDYIWFIDADDRIDKTAIQKLLEQAKTHDADIVMMGANRIYKNHSTSYLSAVDKNEPNFKSRFIRYGMGPWQVIVKRSWWNKNHFHFKEGIIHEDMELMSSLILLTDNFASIDEPLYTYYENDGSVLHKDSWNDHNFDIFPALLSLYQKFKDKNQEKTYHDELEWFFIWNLLIDAANDFSKFPEGKPGFTRTRKILKTYFPNWRKNRFLKAKPLKLRLRVLLNYYK